MAVHVAVTGVSSPQAMALPPTLGGGGVVVAIPSGGAPCVGSGDAWKLPWAGRNGFKPAPVVSVAPIHGPAMDVWRHLGEKIPAPRDSTFQCSKTCLVPLSSRIFSVDSSGSSVGYASRSTLSPNLVWVEEACGKGSPPRC
jgi:hypothetical protein